MSDDDYPFVGHCDECCGDTWVTVGQGTWSQCAFCGEMRHSRVVPKRRRFTREPTRPYSAVVAMLLSQRHRFEAEIERLRADIEVTYEANRYGSAGAAGGANP